MWNIGQESAHFIHLRIMKLFRQFQSPFSIEIRFNILINNFFLRGIQQQPNCERQKRMISLDLY